MTALRFTAPSTARLIKAAAECSGMLKDNPAMSEALAANACLVAASARMLGFPVFRSGRSALRRLTVAQISRYAADAYGAGIPEGGIDGLKKSLRARRLSGCGGGARKRHRVI